MLKTQLPIPVSVVGQEQEEGIRNEPFLELINATSGFNPDFSSTKYGSLRKPQPQAAWLPRAGVALHDPQWHPFQLLSFLREVVPPY